MQTKTSSPWQTGDVILNLYEIIHLLGEGGFGQVYQVRHANWNMDLALKIPKPEILVAAGGIDNFEREAQTWINLGLHPHIVSCYYVRRLKNNPLIFAEYVAGGSLHDWIDSGQLYEGGIETSLPRILDIAIQFAWGLHYAHEQGLIHQDVKPANVMMTPQGAVKVTDFGLSNLRGEWLLADEGEKEDPEISLRVKSNGGMTPAYCSPEQARGETLTRRSDLWSWGLSVLELFQGERTWLMGTIAAQALEFYREGEKNPQLPEMPVSVAELLQHCFQENPDERPGTLLEVASQLQEIYPEITGKVYPRSPIEAGKDTADSLNNRAVSLLDLGKKEEAIQLWEAALSRQPRHPESTYNRGLVRWRSSKINDDSLVRELEEMQNSQPNNGWGNYFLGLVHLERDDCKEAIAQFKTIKIENEQLPEIETACAEAQNRLPRSKRLLYKVPGHAKRVNCVCFSSDGKSVLFGCHDGSLELYSFLTKNSQPFEGHPGEGIKWVGFTPDQRYIISLSQLTLKFWDLTTNQCFWAVSLEQQIKNLYSPSERFVLSLTASVLILREQATGEIIYCFGRGNPEVFLTPDQGFLLLDGQPKLVDVSTGEIRKTFDGHTRQVNALAISSNAQFFISGSEDTTLKLWEIPTGRCLRTFEGHQGAVRAVSLSLKGNFALSAGDTTLKLWEVNTGRCLRTYTVNDPVYALKLTPDGRYAVSGGNSTLKLWAVDSKVQPYVAPMMLCRVQATETLVSTQQIYEHELAQAQDKLKRGDAVGAAQHIRHARSLPGYSRDPEAFKIWTELYLRLPRQAFSSGWENATFIGHTGPINSVGLSFDGRYAVSASSDNTLKLWDVKQGTCLRTFEGYFQGTVNSVSLSLDNQYLLSGSCEGTLKFWEVSTGDAVQSFEDYDGGADTVCISPDGRFAVSGNHEGTLRLWEAKTGRCLRKWKAHKFGVSSVCLSADGQSLLSGEAEHQKLGQEYEKKLKLWDLATGRCLRTLAGHSQGVTSVCLSVDGRFALSGSEDKTLKLWDVVTGDCLRTFAGHLETVTSVCLSVDGRFALSGSEDKTLKLWEIETGHCVRTFEGHTSGVKFVCLSGDGRFALSGSKDGALKQWVLDWELEDKIATNWDENARVYLENFLTLNTPYAVDLPDLYLLEAEREQQEQNKSIYAFFAIVWSATLILFVNGRLFLFIIGLAFGGVTTSKQYATIAAFIWLVAWLTDNLFVPVADHSLLQFVVTELILFAGALSIGIVIGAIAKKVLTLNAISPLKSLLKKVFNWQEIKTPNFSNNKLNFIEITFIFCMLVIAAMFLAINSEYVKFFILPVLVFASLLYLIRMVKAKAEESKYLAKNGLIKTSIIAVIIATTLTSFKATVLSVLRFTPSARYTTPSARYTKPSTRDTTPSTRDTTPSTRDTTPSTRDTTPSARDTTPSARDTTPSARDTTPSTVGVCKDVKTAKHYLEQGGNPNDLTFEDGAYARIPLLECAIRYNKKDVVELLINNGANINKYDSNLLHIAVSQGNIDIAKLLIDKGIDINIKDSSGYTTRGDTALHIAVKRRKASMIKLLLLEGANPSIENKNGYTPLEIASSNGYLEIVQLFDRYGIRK